MRISSVVVKNYRCLRDTVVPFDEYTALVGSNGAGKSSILRALDWFFNGKVLSSDDAHFGSTEDRISVSVTFADLAGHECQTLGRFCVDGKAQFTKHWVIATEQIEYEGVGLTGPGFQAVLNAPDSEVSRIAYNGLRQAIPDLRPIAGNASRNTVLMNIAAWEGDPANAAQLLLTNGLNASEMIGPTGKLAELIGFVFIPGASDFATEFSGNARGSLISRFAADAVAAATDEARNKWQAQHGNVVARLNRMIERGVEKSTQAQVKSVNESLEVLLPGTTLYLRPIVPAFQQKNDPHVVPMIRQGGSVFQLSVHGHGTQRAVMMATVQSYARASSRRPNDSSIVVAIEEPEIFQHPIRIRALARSLAKLAERTGFQVLLATHSPFFVRPEQFPNIRRLQLTASATTVHAPQLNRLAHSLGWQQPQLLRRLEKDLPRSFSELFFADAVVLVEGDTDRVVLEALAAKLRMPFDAAGIAVCSMNSKDDLPLHFRLLQEVAVKTYVILDADSRKHLPLQGAERTRRFTKHRNATNSCLAVVQPADFRGAVVPYNFGDPTLIASNITILEDDLEHELGRWPSYTTKLANARSKDLYAYKQAVQAATIRDLPISFRQIISAIQATVK